MTADLENAIRLLRLAVQDKGPEPSHHDTIMRRHRQEWPRLWNAIDKLLAATDTAQRPLP